MKLYDISYKISNNELTITAVQKQNVKHPITGDMENFIGISLPNHINEKIAINALNSGITLNERNINYEIFMLSKDCNSFASLPKEFTNYQNNSTYKYAKGNSVATIDISLKSSYLLAKFNTEGTKETASNHTNSQANLDIAKNNEKDNIFSEVDNAAITLMEYTGNWELVNNLLPNMSQDGVDKLVEVYNQKNQYSSLAKKKASDYYNMNSTSADARNLALIEKLEHGSFHMFCFLT